MLEIPYIQILTTSESIEVSLLVQIVIWAETTPEQAPRLILMQAGANIDDNATGNATCGT